MEKNIDRSKYYTKDKYGFAIYLVSRLHNDLKINQDLINSLNDEKHSSIKIYLFENPKNYPNTINAKYLNVRNDIFHYGTEPDDYTEYCDIQKKMEDEKINVLLKIKNDKYLDEVGVDYPKISNAFNEVNGEEVYQLLGNVIKLCRNILTDYYKKMT